VARIRRPELLAEAKRQNQVLLARLGAELRSSRRRRRLTQARLGEIVGVVQSTVSDMELGRGGSLSMDVWQRAFGAMERPLLLSLGRDAMEDTADGGHLGIQELVLRLGRASGYAGVFELATRPSDPARSTDVGLRDDRRRRLLLVECWNTIGDVGAAVRASDRKRAEAAQLAVALGGERPHEVSSCWVVRATARNQALVARYPLVFEAKFSGSSWRWVQALLTGSRPPDALGLVWANVRVTRLYPWRRQGR
jgi:transcriptional regulator with XRE-family HTH domain